MCDVSQNRVRVVVPNKLRFTIFKMYHSLSHPGIDATVKLIQRAFVWYNVKRDTANWVRECQACAKSKIQRHNRTPIQQVLPPPSERLTHIYVDITGPLSNSRSFNYLLVVIDRFTRYFQAIPLVGISAQECIDAFIRHWVAWAGCPQHIYTDRGAQFLSVAWREMSKYLGAKLHFATSYHPEAQGIIERFNRTLKTSLTCYGSPNDWYDHLPWVLLALRNTPKQDLSNYSPTELLFRDSVRLPGEFFEERDANTCSEPGPDFAPNLFRFITSLPYFQPRKTNKQRFLDPTFFAVETTHVFVRIDNHKPPLSCVYKGPYKIVDRNPKYFALDIKGKLDKIGRSFKGRISKY